jgi:hypothetical protein
MPEAVSLTTRHTPRIWLAAAAAGALLAFAAGALWAYYGTRVFFEMIAAGIAACF